MSSTRTISRRSFWRPTSRPKSRLFPSPAELLLPTAEGTAKNGSPANLPTGAAGDLSQGGVGPTDGIRPPAMGTRGLRMELWDATTGQSMLTLKGHTGYVTSVAFSPDGKRLASASDDKTVKVWDATSGQATLTLSGHTGRVTSVAFSADGKRLASGNYDQTVKIWGAI